MRENAAADEDEDETKELQYSDGNQHNNSSSSNTVIDQSNISKRQAKDLTIALSSVDIELITVDDGITVCMSLIFSVAARLPLTDWFHLRDVQWHVSHQATLRQGQLYLRKEHQVKAQLIYSSSEHYPAADVLIPLPDLVSSTIPVIIMVNGHEALISVFDFLLTKRVAVKDRKDAGLPYDADLHSQLPLSETVRDYLPGLQLHASHTIRCHLGETGVLTALILVEEKKNGEHSNSTSAVSLIASRPVSLSHRSSYESHTDITLRFNSIPTTHPITVYELLSAVNVTATDIIPAIIAEQMQLHKYAISFRCNSGPLLIVAGETQQQDEFFYLQKKWNKERNQHELFVKIHSQLINADHFPILPHDINVTGLPTAAHPHMYLYSDSLLSEEEIGRINNRNIESCMDHAEEKEWQQIDKKRIKKISIGSAFYTLAQMSHYLVTAFDLSQDHQSPHSNGDEKEKQ